MISTHRFSALCALLLSASAGSPAATSLVAQEQEASFENLRALPEDTSEDELLSWMLGNLRGLGLPRLEGRGCLHCHVGDLSQSRDEWNYVSDEKREKRVARRMMAMVRDINESHLAGLGGSDEALQVTCYTCHAGRLDPRPLPDLLMAAYEEGGVSALLDQYNALRRRYYEGDAYDFRSGVLSGVANTLALGGAFDDALAVSERNEEAHTDDSGARRATLTLLVWRAVATGGADAALAEFRRLRAREARGVLTIGVLDGLGWGLFRAGQQAIALALFQENRSAFPDAYIALESLTDARLNAEIIDTQTAIEQYEEWLERFPGHERARNRVRNLGGGS